MAEIKKLTLKGLYTYRSEFADLPDGALTTCTNLSLDKVNIASPRPGFNVQSLPIAGGNIHSFQDYNNYLLFGQNQLLFKSQTYPDSIQFVTQIPYKTDTNPIPALLPPNGDHFDWASMSGNMYFTTAYGVKKVTNLADGSMAVWDAGMPVPTPVILSIASAPFYVLPAYSEATWRFLFFRKDASGILYFGSPSDPITYTNSIGLPISPVFYMPIPPGFIDDGTWWFQAYRTQVTTSPTSSPSDIPASGDEEFLCAELKLPLTIAKGSTMTWEDHIPDAALGASLYTNSDQSGIASASLPPPTSKYIAAFQNHMFYANTKSVFSLSNQLLGNLTAGSTVTINLNLNTGTIPLTYIVLAENTTTYTYFQFDRADPANPGQLLKYIGQSLVAAINFASTNIVVFTIPTGSIPIGRQYTCSGNTFTVSQALVSGTKLHCVLTSGVSHAGLPLSTGPGSGTLVPVSTGSNINFSDWTMGPQYLQAHYTSGPNDTPGLIEIQTVNPSIDQFSITCSSAEVAQFSPAIYPTAQKAAQSINPHRIYWSDLNEAESVPAPNYHDVGAADDPIVGIVALRDRLIIVKQKSIWRLTGTGPSSFWFQLLDNTVSITAPQSIKRLSNSVFALSNQGVVQISEGVQVVSRRIHDRVTGLNRVTAMAAVDEARGLYLVMPRPPVVGETNPDYRVLVYNTFNDIFYDWVLPNKYLTGSNVTLTPGALYLSNQFTANEPVGVPNPNNRLLFSDGTLPYVQVERKTFTNLDYSDQMLTMTTIAPIASTFNVVSTANLEVGDTIIESGAGATGLGLITAINSATSVTMNILSGFHLTTGIMPLTIYKAIPTELQFWPFIGEGVDWYKDFNELALICPVKIFGTVNVDLQTDEILNPETVDMSNTENTAAWGLFPWGETPWGESSPQDTFVDRILIPWESAKGHELLVTISTLTSNEYWELAGVGVKYRDIAFTPARRQY